MDDNGNRKVFFTQKGMGDILMLQGAMENIYNITKKKQLVCVPDTNKTLFLNNPHVEILYFKLRDRNIEKSIKYLKKRGFDLIWLDYYDLVSVSPFPKIKFSQNPVIATFVSQAGFCGEISLKPVIYLTDEEKKFGKFFQNNQIAIMSGGLSPYKKYPYLKYQEIVNSLNQKYNFVQIGNFTDKKLDGVMDARGKYSIREVAGILYNSSLFVGEIGGLMHLARAVNTRSVIAYTGHEPRDLYSYIANKDIFPENDCDLCLKSIVMPYVTCNEKSKCPKNFSCITSIKVKDMLDAIDLCMNEKSKNKNLEVKKFTIKEPQNIANVKSYFNSFEAVSTRIIKFYLFLLFPFLIIYNYKDVKIKYKIFDFFTFLKIKKDKFVTKYYLFNFLPIFSFEKNTLKFLNFLPLLKKEI